MVQHPTFPFLLIFSFKASDQGRDRLIKAGILLIRGMMMIDGELGINTCRLSDRRAGWMEGGKAGKEKGDDTLMEIDKGEKKGNSIMRGKSCEH